MRYRWPDLWFYSDSAIDPKGVPIHIAERTEQIKPGSELTEVVVETIDGADLEDVAA